VKYAQELELLVSLILVYRSLIYNFGFLSSAMI
jgi:hypothetical protein